MDNQITMKNSKLPYIGLLCSLLLLSIHTVYPADGVLINGVVWATRNVGAPGTFVDKPEDAGMLYQWNRKTAWSATDKTVTDWDVTTPGGDSWEKANDSHTAGLSTCIVLLRKPLARLAFFTRTSVRWNYVPQSARHGG